MNPVRPLRVDRRHHPAADLPRLYERGEILLECEAVFTGVLPDTNAVIAIEGSWGSGRTALFNAACEVAAKAGAVVLRDRGRELEHGTPFGTVVHLLDAASLLTGETEVSPRPVDRLEDLVGPVDRAPGDIERISAQFYAQLTALRELGPVVVGVDDADLADRESLAVLTCVGHRVERRDIWFLVSTRPLLPGVELRPVDLLLSEPGTRRFPLGPLCLDTVRAMLAEHTGRDPDPSLVAACREVTRGRPFLLNALLASVDGQDAWPEADRVGELAVPRIAEVVLGRLARLPVAASDLLQAASVLGDGADPSTAWRLARVDPLAAERALDAAAQMELIEEGRPINFASPLIRSATYHGIPTARRSQLHHHAATLFAELGDGVSAAHHLLATQPGGEAAIVGSLQEAGRSALESGDRDLAMACFARALDELAPFEQRGDIFLDLASAELDRMLPAAVDHLRRAVQAGGSEDTKLVRVAVDLFRALAGAPELKAKALEAVRGVAGHLHGVDRDLQIEFELALCMASNHPAQRSRRLRRLEVLLAEPGDNQRAAPQMAATLLTVRRMVTMAGITAGEAAGLLGGIVDADQPFGPDPLTGTFQMMASYGLLSADCFGEVDRYLEKAMEWVRTRGLLGEELKLLVLSSVSALWQGSLTAAEACSRRGRDLAAQLDGQGALGPTIALVDALVCQGRLAEALVYAVDVVPEAISDPIARAAAREVRGQVLMAQDRLGEALTEFLAAGEELAGAGVVNPSFGPWRARAATAMGALGMWEEAGAMADEHLRLARSFGAARALGMGLRAKAAATSDRPARIECLAEAVTVLEPSGARLEAAWALVELGTALVGTGEKDRARGILRSGANVASTCGAHELLEKAGTQLRAAGARPRRLGSVGVDSLTPAELRVARLAACGKTNQDIGETLYVTVKTVEGHLAKAYRKLDIDSRRELRAVLGPGSGFHESLPRTKAG